MQNVEIIVTKPEKYTTQFRDILIFNHLEFVVLKALVGVGYFFRLIPMPITCHLMGIP